MAHPYHHSLSSVKKWGGSVFDYLPLHSWFDLMWTGKSFSADTSAEVASTGRVPYLLQPRVAYGIINGRELRVAPQFEFPLWEGFRMPARRRPVQPW
jgi:Domain of unknown function (DUF6915)